MGRIPPHEVERIKQANDIVDVISQYVRLEKHSGSNLFGLCPFHGEKTPSFSVSRTKQIYYCFGCHKGGDVVSFIKEMEHLNYGEALRFLADRAGLTIEESQDRIDPQAEQKRRQKALLKEIAKYFMLQLSKPSGAVATRYLKARQVEADLAYRFALGYCPRNTDALIQDLKAKGFTHEELMTSGLWREGQRGTYCIFSNRLMFPILDAFGQVLALGESFKLGLGVRSTSTPLKL